MADEIAFGPENLAVPRDEIVRRVEEGLDVARLKGFEEREPYNLSGGEQQACAIAAIFAMYPEIYVMDEPTSNLDPLGTQRVLSMIVNVAKERGKTLLIAEHKLEEILQQTLTDEELGNNRSDYGNETFSHPLDDEYWKRRGKR